MFADDTGITGSNGMSSIISDDVLLTDGEVNEYINFNDIGCSGLYLPDSGVAITLKDTEGNIADTFVFDSGPASQDGWTSEAISIPSSSVSSDEFVYIRGDGAHICQILTRQTIGVISGQSLAHLELFAYSHSLPRVKRS